MTFNKSVKQSGHLLGSYEGIVCMCWYVCACTHVVSVLPFYLQAQILHKNAGIWS